MYEEIIEILILYIDIKNIETQWVVGFKICFKMPLKWFAIIVNINYNIVVFLFMED